jgi:hypothetical protein
MTTRRREQRRGLAQTALITAAVGLGVGACTSGDPSGGRSPLGDEVAGTVPRRIVVSEPASGAPPSTLAATSRIEGVVLGGTSAVHWATTQGAAGDAAGEASFAIDAVPLELGSNTVTLTTPSTVVGQEIATTPTVVRNRFLAVAGAPELSRHSVLPIPGEHVSVLVSLRYDPAALDTASLQVARVMADGSTQPMAPLAPVSLANPPPGQLTLYSDLRFDGVPLGDAELVVTGSDLPGTSTERAPLATVRVLRNPSLTKFYASTGLLASLGELAALHPRASASELRELALGQLSGNPAVLRYGTMQDDTVVWFQTIAGFPAALVLPEPGTRSGPVAIGRPSGWVAGAFQFEPAPAGEYRTPGRPNPAEKGPTIAPSPGTPPSSGRASSSS